MGKKELIRILDIMAAKYNEAVKIKDYNGLIMFLIKNHMTGGFCLFLGEELEIFPPKYVKDLPIYKELKKDITKIEIELDHELESEFEVYGYFYPVVFHKKQKDFNNIINYQLKPRLDNINRTLLRLKNELKYPDASKLA